MAVLSLAACLGMRLARCDLFCTNDELCGEAVKQTRELFADSLRCWQYFGNHCDSETRMTPFGGADMLLLKPKNFELPHAVLFDFGLRQYDLKDCDLYTAAGGRRSVKIWLSSRRCWRDLYFNTKICPLR